MSFIESPASPKIITDVNAEILSLQGFLEDEPNKYYLAKFLENNLAFTMNLLTGADGKGIEMYPFQEILLKMLFDKDNVLTICGRGIGKCLQYSNSTYLIEKNTGFSHIKNILPNLKFNQDEELENINRLELWNGDSWQSTSRILKQSKKDSATVVTSLGYKLGGSTNHLIKVLDEKICRIVWKRYHELKIGDKICVDRSEPEWEIESIEDDEAYFVGLLLGDGCISARAYSISSADKQTIDFCVEKYKCKIIPDKRSSACCSIRVNTEISQWYKQKYDFKEELSYFKKIPQRILKSKKATKNCLQGLFDCDGSVCKNGTIIDFCSTSEEMAYQVHTLLLTFGITSRIRLKTTKSKFGKAWLVYITGENCKKFMEKIGFRLSRKNNLALKYLALNKKFNTNNNVVYGANEQMSLVKKSLKMIGEMSNEWHTKHRKRRKSQQKEISYERLSSVLDFFKRNEVNNDIINDLLEIEKTNYFFDPIVSIELYQDDCIDFCDIPNGNCYWSNGFLSHNTTIAVWFIALYCILYPKTKIGILSPSFRKSRDIYKGVEDLAGMKGAHLLRQCIKDKKQAPDLCWMQFENGSEIFSLPLGSSGEKIRGYRFQVVILDEAGFVPEKIITNVIIPFLSTNFDPIEREKTRNRENDLIAKGLMTESDRMIYKNNKFLAFSSATYQFEFLYQMYKNYKKSILDPKPDQFASYGLFQMSHEAAPEGLLNKASTENAKNSLSSMEFQKEYCGQFPADSDSYFKMSKMEDATVPSGEDPSIEIVGEKNGKYLVSIDPNSMNDATSSDHFAISVFKLNMEDNTTVLVNQFAACELNIIDYVWYFSYILENFNVVMVVLDEAGGGTFINVCNESIQFKEKNLRLEFFSADFDVDPKEYVKELNRARRDYNLTSKKICYSQYFLNPFKLAANEHLKYCIEYKKMLFASKPHEIKEEKMLKTHIPNFDKLKFISGEDFDQKMSNDDMQKIRRQDFIDHQVFLMKDVKCQCALIELRPEGNSIKLELPSNIRRLRGINMVRRDLWTSLFLGNYMAKRYFDMMSTDDRFNYNSNWTPSIVG
jgi:intein/homing endonuclease